MTEDAWLRNTAQQGMNLRDEPALVTDVLLVCAATDGSGKRDLYYMWTPMSPGYLLRAMALEAQTFPFDVQSEPEDFLGEDFLN